MRRLPSKGMSSPIFMRGSAMTLRLPSSRAALDGQTIQENTTVSPASAFTARLQSVTLPSGTSSPQLHDPGRAIFLEDRRRLGGHVAISLLLVGRHGDHESVDVAHF